jgi:uncharacterized protein (TIGR00255 family)
MLRSMTGFAQAQAEDPPWALRVTLKALNHRFLDLHLRLPAELEPHEPRLRARLKAEVQRGHLEVQYTVERIGRRTLEVDAEFVGSYLELFRRLQREHQIAGEPDLAAVLRLPGVLRGEARAADAVEADRLAALAERVLGEAVGRLNEMRRAEGAALERDLQECLGRIERGGRELARLSERALPATHQRLTERLQELLGGAELDSARLAEEAAYLAERGDVREELTRLASHAEQFAALLAGDGAVGKRLDFLLQEMNRESNTILSKVPGLAGEGVEMTRVGLELKAQIERLREQVQNVE